MRQLSRVPPLTRLCHELASWWPVEEGPPRPLTVSGTLDTHLSQRGRPPLPQRHGVCGPPPTGLALTWGMQGKCCLLSQASRFPLSFPQNVATTCEETLICLLHSEAWARSSPTCRPVSEVVSDSSRPVEPPDVSSHGREPGLEQLSQPHGNPNQCRQRRCWSPQAWGCFVTQQS